MNLQAPAKINLFLRVLARRADGYCELQTAFQFLDLSDELFMELRSEDRLSVEVDSTWPCSEGVPVDESNSVLRAARLLQVHCGVSRGAHIRLRKRIPVGGGLGGGSSDAASALLGLNQLWACGLTRGELAILGRYLGADVPVFVHGCAAYATGLGELLVPHDWPEHDYLLVVPGTVSTAEVFALVDVDHRCHRLPAGDLYARGENDFADLVRTRYPAVEAAWSWLASFVEPRLTGTGAGLFAYFENRGKIGELLTQLPKNNLRAFAVRSLNKSPARMMTGREH